MSWKNKPSELADQDTISLSFVGCGFLSFYYIGVTACLRQFSQINEKTIISCVSAGTVPSLCLCLKLSLGDSIAQMLELAREIRSRPLGLIHTSSKINKMIYHILDKLLPDDCHKKVSGRLYICMTRVSDGKSVIISQFDSKDELIKVVQCSSFIPFISGIVPPKYKGISYIDGGLSNNAPKLNEKTITVSPLMGEFDICPISDTSLPNQVMFYNKLISLSPSNLYRMSQVAYPPSWPVKTMLCKQGFDDTLRFLLRSNRISHNICRPSFPLYKDTEKDNQSIDSRYDNNNNEELNTYREDIPCIQCENRADVENNQSIPQVIVKVIEEAHHQHNRRIVNRFPVIKLLLILLSPFLLLFEWLKFIILGLLFNDWSFQELVNILKILKIIVTNGLVGKYHTIR